MDKKIEVGKFYRTYSNMKVFCHFKHHFNQEYEVTQKYSVVIVEEYDRYQIDEYGRHMGGFNDWNILDEWNDNMISSHQLERHWVKRVEKNNERVAKILEYLNE